MLIKEIIEIYKNRNINKEPNLLINNSDLKEIKNKYLNYLNGNHILINDWKYSSEDKIIIIKRKN